MTRKTNTDKDFLGTPPAAPAPARRKTTAKPRAKRSSALEENTSAAAEPVQTPALQSEAAPAAEPSPEEISLLAYTYWEERGGQGGCAEEDWVRAEQTLRQRAAAASA